ncbi:MULTISPECIES: HEAT repeat domain-containing protein [unclassified Amycolatopsis]|uniref:HEAT repeat domain-containing protein n=1 Tax=unclassified Amycolatopsis TaxID=2618356 RepID=UPI001C6A6746|nr:HEAT repeat domain-containing protein [Amycolatopsis sp. DSM 110486]QYN22996.1 HEAT repeat domain-containing protein [Amycolatopsis sp. DSM 110486]
MNTEHEIDRLIRLLDSDTLDANAMGAADAQWDLTALGREADVVAPLLLALPNFGSFAQLCAIEIFQQLQDTRAIGALIDLLAGDNSTVREWAAGALADLRATGAVPALRRAWETSKARGDAPVRASSGACAWR